MSVKKTILKTLLEGQIVELMVKSQVDNIYLEDGQTTLASKLAEIVTDLGTKASTDDLNIALEGVIKDTEVQSMIDDSIKAAVDGLIDGAPGTYDTLNEIAQYLATHQNEYTALVETVAGKVDKVEGKGLSTEDFTTALKTKLEGLSNYILEAASADKLGGVKIGANIDVTAEGVISVKEASTTQAGVVQLSDSVSSDVSNMAATSKAVKTAYDAAVAKSDFIVSASQPEGLREGDLWAQLVE